MIDGTTEIYGLGKIRDAYNRGDWQGSAIICVDRKGKEVSKRLIDVYKKKINDKWSFEISMANGNEIIVSENQILLTAEGKKICGDEIEIGTILKCHSCKKDAVAKVKKLIIEEMYNLSIEGDNCYIANDFILSPI